MRALFLAALVAPLAVGLVASAALAQEPTFDDVRAQFGDLTRAQIEEMGYVVEPVCVDAGELPPPVREQLGLTATAAMGFHAVNEDLFDDVVDALEPEVVLLGSNDEVWGVEYEVSIDAQDPQVLGQPLPILEGGHPGMEFDHYAMHAWFIDNPAGQFADFNPAVSCPASGAAPAGAAEPAQAEPPALPATGSGGYLGSESDGGLGTTWIAIIVAGFATATVAGWWAWRRFVRI